MEEKKKSGFDHSDFSKVSEFERAGYLYHKHNESEHYILWRVDTGTEKWNHSWDKYELWKKRYIKNQDGTSVVRKCGDEDGGKALWWFNNWQDFQWAVKNNPKFKNEELTELAR